jgi:hypothetical protein
LYEYTYDGTTNYWVDIVSPAFAAGVVANIAISGSMLVNANVTYDIGSSSQGFRTIYANTVSTFGNVVGGNINTAGDMSVGGNLTVTGNAILSGNIVADRVQNGTSQIDIQTANGNANITINGNSNVAVFSEGALTMKGNVLPSANITYNLGSSTQRWNDLYIAGNTIDLNGSTITSDANGITLTNPLGGTFTVVGQGASNTASIVSGNSSIVSDKNIIRNILNKNQEKYILSQKTILKNSICGNSVIPFIFFKKDLYNYVDIDDKEDLKKIKLIIKKIK